MGQDALSPPGALLPGRGSPPSPHPTKPFQLALPALGSRRSPARVTSQYLACAGKGGAEPRAAEPGAGGNPPALGAGVRRAHTAPIELRPGRGQRQPRQGGTVPPERLSPPTPGGEAVPGGTSMEGTEFPTPHPGRAGLPSVGHSGSWKSAVPSKGGRAAVSLHPELCSHTGRGVTAGTFVSWTFGIVLEPCQAHSCASVSCWRSSAEGTPHSLGNSVPQCQELGWSSSWAPRNFLGCSDLSGRGNVAVRVERRDLASRWWVW